MKDVKKIDFLFYHISNIQALIILINHSLLLLCNNYRFEEAFDFVVIDAFYKGVPYEINLPILLLEQSSLGNIILCNTRQPYLIRNKVKSSKKRVKTSEDDTIIRMLHDSHSNIYL